MKTVYTILGLLLFHACLAQNPTQKVYQTKNLDAYVGVWQYVSGTDTFQVALRKGIKSTRFSYSECLIGGYKYVKNGVIVYSHVQNFPSTFTNENFETFDMTIAIMGTNAFVDPNQIDPNEVRIFFKDRGLNKTTQSGLLILLSPSQARWTLKDDEGDFVYLPGEIIPADGFSVPTDVVMTKISDTVPGLGTRFSGILDDDLMDVGETNP